MGFKGLLNIINPAKLVTHKISRSASKIAAQDKSVCPVCHKHMDGAELESNFYVCSICGYHYRLKPWERVRFTADDGVFHEFGSDIESLNPIDFPDYDKKLEASKIKSQTNDAVISGLCKIKGNDAVLAVMSFPFMGGSMGSVVGEKITRSIMEGIKQKLPVILFTASGGARMQEGIFSLMQMAKTSNAAALLEEAGLPLIIILSDPTYGGVTASFAMLGDINLSEPGALIGFAGPRVIEGTIKQKLPEGFQRAEFQLEKGFVDAIVDRRDMKNKLAFILQMHKPLGRVKK